MPSSRLRHSALLLALLLGASLVAGCSPSGAGASSPVANLPLYTPEAAVLFDDVFAPAVFGFDPEGRIPARDPMLRDRTRLADFVVAARVETVSRVGGVAHSGSYDITLAPFGKPLAGESPDREVVVNVPATNPSYPWVDGAGASWVGSRLLLFGRRFQNGNRAALHFRCEPDTAALRAAIEHDAGLRELR